jgi:hypothetical protein
MAGITGFSARAAGKRRSVTAGAVDKLTESKLQELSMEIVRQRVGPAGLVRERLMARETANTAGTSAKRFRMAGDALVVRVVSFVEYNAMEIRGSGIIPSDLVNLRPRLIRRWKIVFELAAPCDSKNEECDDTTCPAEPE